MTTFLDKLSSRERKIMVVVLVLVVLVGGYHAAWRPMMEKMASLDDDIFAMQMRLRKAKIFIRQKDDVAEASREYRNLEKLDARSDEEEIARLLNFIEQTARKHSVALSDVKPQPVQSDKLTKRYTVELNAESSLESVVRFVHDLEQSEELLRVGQASLAPREESSPVIRSFILVSRVVVK